MKRVQKLKPEKCLQKGPCWGYRDLISNCLEVRNDRPLAESITSEVSYAL